uniref:Uncharacterized protein n=1 Tax=Nelumbo nucifera TaxID=4432 RepID=A0A822ZFB7_NELNU|nr:TPA_asm: hypothetical protein HUJ06_001440 [Nelumbo nucifera]
MLEVWDMTAEEKIVVQLDEMGRPIGDEGKTGTMVRRAQFAPINYIKWKDMPRTYKDDMWTTVDMH